MVQSTQSREGVDCALSPTSDRYWSTGWRILRQSEVRPIFMVVAHILGYPYNVDNFFNMPGERFPNVPVSPNETTEDVYKRQVLDDGPQQYRVRVRIRPNIEPRMHLCQHQDIE